MSAIDKFRKEQGLKNRPELPPEQTVEEQLGTVYVSKKRMEAKAGSQRRCYDGCFPSSDWESVWSSWEVLRTNVPQSNLTFWVDLAEYSVSVGGSANTKYKWEKNDDDS